MAGGDWTHLHDLNDVLDARHDDSVQVGDSYRLPTLSRARFRSPDRSMEVAIEVHAPDGRPFVRSLTVTAADDRGVDRDRVRRVPVGELMRRCVAVATWVRHPERGWELSNEAASAAERKLSPTGRPIADAELSEVARVYTEHQGSTPTQAVAAHFHLSPSGAAKRVAKARRAGLLPPTVKGRATNRSIEED